jgi:hypothetical protein
MGRFPNMGRCIISYKEVLKHWEFKPLTMFYDFPGFLLRVTILLSWILTQNIPGRESSFTKASFVHLSCWVLERDASIQSQNCDIVTLRSHNQQLCTRCAFLFNLWSFLSHCRTSECVLGCNITWLSDWVTALLVVSRWAVFITMGISEFFLFILAESWIFVIYGEKVTHTHTDVSMCLWYFTYVYSECAGSAAKDILFNFKYPECENPGYLQINRNVNHMFSFAVLKLWLFLSSYNKNQQDAQFTFNWFQ